MGAPAGFASPGGTVQRCSIGRRHTTDDSAPGSTRSNNSAGNSVPGGRTRAPSHQGMCRRCRSVGDDRTRSRSAVLRRPGAARPRRSLPLLWALHVGSRGWHHHGRERGPFGFSRWGRGKRLGAERAQARGLRDLRRRLQSSPKALPRSGTISSTINTQSITHQTCSQRVKQSC